MDLTPKQKKYLTGLAHSLKPMVQVGRNGVSDAIIKEIHRSLKDHELIKVKVSSEDQEQFQAAVSLITDQLDAVLVKKIGHSIILYRESDTDPQINLPKA